MNPELLFAAAVIFVGGLALLAPRLGLALGLAVVFARVLVPLVYFGFLDTGTWRLFDDVTYAQEAVELASTGAGPLGVLVDSNVSATLFQVAGGRHVGYYVHNVVAQAAFGEHYWAAVFLNVLLTCLAACAVWRLVRMMGRSRGFARAATVFFLLQWDVVVWSSFLNLKDTLVMVLTAWMFVGGVALARRPSILAAIQLLGCAFALTFLRWYVPFLALGVLGAWGIVHLRGWRRGALVALFLASLSSGLVWSAETEMIQPGDALAGLVRFALTPRPWGIEPRYSFLLFPAILHWVLAPIAVVGAVQLWRRSKIGRVLVLYLVALVLFYALVPELQGPRHRYQGVFVLSLLQFQGLATWAEQALGRLRAARPPAGIERRTMGLPV